MERANRSPAPEPSSAPALQPWVLVRQAMGARRHLDWEAQGGSISSVRRLEVSTEEPLEQPGPASGGRYRDRPLWGGAAQTQVMFTTMRPLLPEALPLPVATGSQSPH